jgi:hypothetical protein
MVRDAENDDQEHERHHDFGEDCGAHAVLAGRQAAVAVRSKARRRDRIPLAACDDVENRRGDDRAGNLRTQ